MGWRPPPPIRAWCFVYAWMGFRASGYRLEWTLEARRGFRSWWLSTVWAYAVTTRPCLFQGKGSWYVIRTATGTLWGTLNTSVGALVRMVLWAPLWYNCNKEPRKDSFGNGWNCYFKPSPHKPKPTNLSLTGKNQRATSGFELRLVRGTGDSTLELCGLGLSRSLESEFRVWGYLGLWGLGIVRIWDVTIWLDFGSCWFPFRELSRARVLL